MNFMKIKNSKNDISGITLIALVITIIVFLILAGITISMLSGDNSILKRAIDAHDKTEQSQLEEEVGLAYLGFISQINKTDDLEHYLNMIDNANVEKLAMDTWYVSRKKASVTVYDDGEIAAGKIELWDGTNMECPVFKDFNWYIYTASQLKFLADFVNNENTITTEQETMLADAGYNTSDVAITESTTIYLMNNLDLGARASLGSTEETKWETTANETRKWEPIGIDNSNKKLIGIFEGNNHTIRGVYVNREEKFNGIFGNANTIQNLTIINSYIKGKRVTAGIVGALRSGTIINCHNKNTTVILAEGTDNYAVAGVVGQIIGCEGAYNLSNTGKIISYGYYSSEENIVYCGGVVAYLKASTISECTNYGEIQSNNLGINTGGVVGMLASGTDASPTIVNNCSNYGKVDGISHVGGVVGQANKNTIITNCYNEGIITSENRYIGGIVGGFGGQNSLINNYNKGNVSGVNFGFVIGSVSDTSTYSNLYYFSGLEINSNGRNSEETTVTQSIDNNFNSLTEFLNWLENQ